MFTSEIEEVHPFNAMKSVQCYEIIEEISQSEKRVYLYIAKYVKPEPKDVSGKFVLIKVFKSPRLMNNVICLARDIEHSRYSDHMNVSKKYCSFMEKGDLWVVMKCNHVVSMARVVAKRFHASGGGLPERMVGFVLREALKGLDYLHGRRWMHKNFELGHIFVDKDDVVRIDFDTLAYDPDGKFEEPVAVGSGWPAPPPEMLTDDGLELKSDIWCFGIAALKLALGHIPARSYEELLAFLADWPEKLEREAASAKKESKQGSWFRRFGCFYGRLQAEDGEKKVNNISLAFVKMVTECLTPDQSKRPTTRQLLESDFFRELQGQNPPSFIESLLE